MQHVAIGAELYCLQSVTKTYFGQEIRFIGTTRIAFGGHFNWLTIIWLVETVHLFLLSNATEQVT